VDIVISPTTVAFNTQPGTPNPTLQAGEVVDALVLQLLDNGAVRLSIGNSIFDAQTQVPLVPGSTVRLAVKNTNDGIKLVILDNAGSNAAAGAANAATSAMGRAAAVTDAIAAGGSNVSDASSKQTSGVAPAVTSEAADLTRPAAPVVALSQAVRVAALQQNGLAPLFADVTEATAGANAASLPQPVRDAAEQLLALRPALDGNLSGDDVKQAFLQSGLFLEARIAAATKAGASQTSSGDGGHAASAEGAASDVPSPSVPAPTDDLKAALTVFRQVLKAWLDADPATAARFGDALSAGPTRAGLPLPVLPRSPSLAPDAANADAEERPSAPLAPIPPAPPPPYRGAPPASQPAAASTIPAGADTHEIGARLLAETDSALSRQTLLQAAWLPDATNTQAGQAAHGEAAGPRWNFEVPFATPQGTAVAQFEIARDGRSTPTEGIKPVWRARFTLDVEPMGAVHAHVALIGTRAAVTLWAERGESAAMLRESAPMLSDALRRAELEPGDVLVRDGSPPRPRQAAPAGKFLDRAS